MKAGNLTERTEIYPEHVFYAVTVTVEQQNDDTGKTKKTREIYLIDAEDVSGAEKGAVSLMGGVAGTWEIESVSKSKICGVLSFRTQNL